MFSSFFGQAFPQREGSIPTMGNSNSFIDLASSYKLWSKDELDEVCNELLEDGDSSQPPYESQESVDKFDLVDIKGTPEHALYQLLKNHKKEFKQFVKQVAK